ncbi:MAG TPA: hypothetical protein VD907_02040 [Verrucomicrobiae bacterium]|nr:hypothetical protein [Verrucomicrobiae bacterium]
MQTTVHLAVPHLINHVTPDPWITNLMIAVFVVWGADFFADKIPGVKGFQRAPQIIALLLVAVSFDTLSDVKLISSLRDLFIKLIESWGAGEWLWNIGTGGVALVIAALYALRYMGLSFGEKLNFLPNKGAENIFWDGIGFGLAIFAGSVLAPWLADAMEFLRYSLFAIFQVLIFGTLNLLGKVGFTA